MGYLRLLLALAVTIQHLWIVNDLGHVAVFGLYCISGFYITKIIHEIYGSTLNGRLYFVINRILRIYPTYFACLTIALICILAMPESLQKSHAAMIRPHHLKEWLPNIFIFGLGHSFPVRVMPPAWSLYTELLYYLVMCFVIGTSFIRCVIWCLFSFEMSVYLIWNHYPFNYHYFSLYGPSTCFAAGALAYHACSFIPKVYLLPVRLALMVGILLICIPILFHFKLFTVWYLYCAIPIFMYVIICLDAPQQSGGWEHIAADLAYPIYLLHLPIGGLILQTLKPSPFLLWAGATSLTILASFLVVKIIQRSTYSLRRSIRKRAALYNKKASLL